MLAVSISFFPFLLPLYLTIIRLNSVKVLTYAYQLQKKASGTKSTNLVKLPDIASQIELKKKGFFHTPICEKMQVKRLTNKARLGG